MCLLQIGLVGILRGIFLHEKTEHRLYISPLIEIENALSSCKILCSPLDNQSFCRKIDAKYSKKRYGIFVAHLTLQSGMHIGTRIACSLWQQERHI